MSISTEELAAIRADVAAVALSLRGTITRTTVGAVDDYGNPSETAGTVGVVDCALAIQQNRDQRTEGAGREVERNVYILTLPYNADIAPDDYVVIESQRYSVINLWDAHILRACKRANVERLD